MHSKYEAAPARIALSQSLKFAGRMSIVALGILGCLTIALTTGSEADPLLPPGLTRPLGVTIGPNNSYMASSTGAPCVCSGTNGGGSCLYPANPLVCTVTFPAVPAGNGLSVTNVSCALWVSNTSPFIIEFLGAQPSFLTPDAVGSASGFTSDNGYYYGVKGWDLGSYTAAGQTPVLSMIFPVAGYGTNALAFECTIAGQLQ
jgi:hypothetical protein